MKKGTRAYEAFIFIWLAKDIREGGDERGDDMRIGIEMGRDAVANSEVM